MIKSKKDLQYYLNADREVYGKGSGLKAKLKETILPDSNYKFMRLCRMYEYHYNLGHKLRAYYYAYRYGKQGLKIGVSLPPNVVGPGCHITHGKFIANPDAQIGSQCKIFDNVTVAGTGRYDIQGAPRIGDRVVLCAGAKIIGPINIADDVVVAAGAVVVKDVTEQGITVGGIPARKISNTNSFSYLNRV